MDRQTGGLFWVCRAELEIPKSAEVEIHNLPMTGEAAPGIL